MQKYFSSIKVLIRNALLVVLAMPAAGYSTEISDKNSPHPNDLPIDLVPQLKDEPTRLTYQKGDLLAVPIPLSNPTFGTGLIAASAYFYGQTAEEKKLQPASFTGAAAAYTSNKSRAIGLTQQNYWGGDKWRFSAIAGYIDFKLELRDPVPGNDSKLDWVVKGGVFQTTLMRRIFNRWYAGILGRYLNMDQALAINIPEDIYRLGGKISSTGGGLLLRYDTRDLPTNAFKGQLLELDAVTSTTSGDVNERYQSYGARYRFYHKLEMPLVFAVDADACSRSGKLPLWDTCRINLRGFPMTDYLGVKSYQGQLEARWNAWKNLGFVAFGGLGYVGKSFGDALENRRVPSYGAGVRYMLLKSKRINLRVDYARSDNSDAWYLAVGEAF
jgi:hypothetical protein